jgi:two-component system heavy metal sensor histidine kinase CusS
MSLAARLGFWFAGSSFALILAAVGYLYWALGENLQAEDEGIIADQIGILRDLMAKGDEAGLRQEVDLEAKTRQHEKVFIRILASDGRPALETAGMDAEAPVRLFPPPSPRVAADVRGPSGRSYDIASARLPYGPGREDRVAQVALDSSREEELLAAFRWRMAPALAAALLLCAFGGYALARGGVRPVERIAEAAARVRSSTLAERIPTAGLPAELGSLADRFNEMLARLEEAFARLSRFSADIAHELRTPVNNLRGEIEVALGKPRSPDEYAQVLGSALEECGRLARMIDGLLFLARAEDPATQIRRERCEMGRELEGVRDFYEAAAAEKGIALSVAKDGPLEVEVDRTLFQRAVGNLVENALAHTPRGGRVTLGAARENGGLRIEVADTGCGIPAEHLPRVFDRFYRVDGSRTAATGGMGLGLAIVKGIAELHGGKAEIASEPGKGTRVALILPGHLSR